MYNLPRDASGNAIEAQAKRGSGSSALFVARNRFVVLDKGTIAIKDLDDNTTKQIKPTATVTDLFYAGGKNILLATATSIILFDTDTRVNVAELGFMGVRYMAWSTDQTHVAFISKHSNIVLM
jgi:coatomer subunit alpha